jgi:hypothetical protein
MSTANGGEGVAPSEAAVVEIADAGGGREIDKLPAPLQNLPQKDHAQDIRLKRIYALALLVGLGIQVAIVDGVFVAYAWAGVNWNVAEPVMSIWLGATVINVIGVVLVVTSYLFPQRSATDMPNPRK